MSDVSVHSPTEKIVQGELDGRIEAIEKTMSGDVITFVGSLLYGSETVFRDQVDGLATDDRKESLLSSLRLTAVTSKWCRE